MDNHFLAILAPNTHPTVFLSVLTVLLFVLTIATRFLPFWLQGTFKKSPLLQKLGDYFPSVIMLLLVFHALEGVKWQQAPYGLIELSAIAMAIILYVWKRNLLLALLPSTAIYVIIINIM